MTTAEQIEVVKAYCRDLRYTCEGAVGEDAVHAHNDVKRHVLGLLADAAGGAVVTQPQGAEKWARHLVRVSRNVRATGDMPMVMLTDEGVGHVEMTLADELFVVALNLDFDAAMDENRDRPAAGGAS